jgi:hypothetical protein
VPLPPADEIPVAGDLDSAKYVQIVLHDATPLRRIGHRLVVTPAFMIAVMLGPESTIGLVAICRVV